MWNRLANDLTQRLVLGGGFIATVTGAGIALQRNWPWLAFILLVHLAAASLYLAHKSYRTSATVNAMYQREKADHEKTKDKLERAATEALDRIDILLRQYSLGHAAATIRRSIALMKRMYLLVSQWGKPPKVIRFTTTHGQLYATIKFAGATSVHIHEGDPFVLIHDGRDGLRHKVGMLRVHQPPDKKKGVVFLIADEVFNEETMNALLALADVADQRPSGFTIELPFDPRMLDGHNLESADALMDAMAENLNELYLEEVQNV